MTAPERSHGTVLIADDDALVRGVLRMALSRAGYTVVEARDAADALAVAQQSDPDIVVLDINMPGGTVHETLGSLRDRRPELPVLVLSGENSPPADLIGARSDFARKPIELDDLLARIQTLLNASDGRP
jgi:DNA-binding response OmpR family regulator